MEPPPGMDAARPLLDLLREWSGWAARRRDGEPLPLPSLILHLRSGRDLRGSLVDLSETPAGQDVLLAVEPAGEGSPESVRAYLPAGSIEAISVVSFGSAQPDEPSPPRMQFRRELAAWEKTLEEQFGTPIEVPSDFAREDLAVLSTLYGHLRGFFEGWAADPVSREPISGKVKRIELLTAREASVTLANRALTIVTCANAFDRMSPRRLKTEIEALL